MDEHGRDRGGRRWWRGGLLAVPAAAVLLLGACGGGGDDNTTASTAATTGTTATTATTATTGTTGTTGTTATAPQDASAAVDQAFRDLRQHSYRADIKNTSVFDASGAPEQVQQALASADADTSSQVEAESADRAKATTQLSGGLGELQIVLYDGGLYVSKDGTTWQELKGDLKTFFDQVFALSKLDVSALAKNIRQEGETEVDGVAAVKYVGDVDPSQYQKIAGSLLQGLGPAASSVSFDGGTIEVLVAKDDGRLLQQAVTVDATIDLSQLGSQGKVTAKSTSTYTVKDYGADITVEKPKPSGTLSTLTELGQFVQ